MARRRTNKNPEPAPRLERILRLHQLSEYVGLRRTQIDVLRKAGKFPRGFNISERAVGWFESDIIKWQQQRRAVKQGSAA